MNDIAEVTDPVALAREFLDGRNLKRSSIVEMVHCLITLIEELQSLPLPLKTICVPTSDIPRGVPAIEGYDQRSPIKVQNGTAGSVYLGPESNRYYTRAEAVALAGAIARAAATR